MKNLLPLFLLFTSSPAWSYAGIGNFAAGGLSDGVYYRYLTLTALTQPTELTYPYRDETEDQLSYGLIGETDYRELYGLHTNTYLFSALVTKKFDARVQVTANLGVDRAVTVGQDSALKGHGLLSVSGTELSQKLDYTLSFQQGLAYSIVEVQDRLPSLRTNDIDLKLTYLIDPRWKLETQGNWGWLSDGNVRKFAAADLMYGVGITEPWFWVGIGGDWLRFINQTDDYWSPGRFKGFGPRIEFDTPVVGEFSFLLAGSIDRIQEDSNDWGWGDYSSVGLQYRKRDENHFTLTWNQVRSERNDALWTQNEVVLNFMGYF